MIIDLYCNYSFKNNTVSPPDIWNRVAVEDRVNTATPIAIHNFRIAVFSYAQRSSSAQETNQVQTAVCLFSPRFPLGLNFSYSYSTAYVQFYKKFSQITFNLFYIYTRNTPNRRRTFLSFILRTNLKTFRPTPIVSLIKDFSGNHNKKLKLVFTVLKTVP